MANKPPRPLFTLSAMLALSVIFAVASATAAHAVTIPTVPVGNPGNAADPLTGNVHGSVSYNYRIGTTEVTNAQYAEFLNAKAASDPLELYSPAMNNDGYGGITRAGDSGSYTYVTKPNMGNKPVNHVGWYDAIRFANWLNNGQGLGDTETGAYTLLGGTPTPSNALSITRNAGATWFLTSNDEWYKAAFHQPATQGGDGDNYWRYPTASNTAPMAAFANGVGDISNPGANVANYLSLANWNGSFLGNVTTVGSAGPLSHSFYGTSDQGGNVWEWIDSAKYTRGGSFYFSAAYDLEGSGSFAANPLNGGHQVGFRVATIPEPSTLLMGVLGMVGLLWWSKRSK